MNYRPHRYPTQFPVTLQSRMGEHSAQVVDVNMHGAKLQGQNFLRRGDKVTLDVMSHRVDAIVSWARRDSCGISFRPQISTDMLDTLRHRKDGRHPRRRRTVGFRFAEMR